MHIDTYTVHVHNDVYYDIMRYMKVNKQLKCMIVKIHSGVFVNESQYIAEMIICNAFQLWCAMTSVNYQCCDNANKLSIIHCI